MVYRVLCIGDPHIRIDNLEETDLMINAINNICADKSPDLIVVLGDLLHTHERVHVTPLNKAYDFIKQLSKNKLTYVLVGNHDMINNQQFITQNHWMNAMKSWPNVVVVDQPEILETDMHKFTFVPYVYPGRFIEALNTLNTKWDDSNCIFAHQEFAGCKMGAITSEIGDVWGKDMPDVVSGHIHAKQKVGDNIYYPGSVMQHAFGESEKNTVALLTFASEKRYTLEEIDLNLPRKKTVYLKVEDIDSFTLKQTNGIPAKVRISLTGDAEKFKALKKSKKYKELIANGVKVVFKKDKILDENIKVANDDSRRSNFSEILSRIITEKGDPHVHDAFEHVIREV